MLPNASSLASAKVSPMASPVPFEGEGNPTGQFSYVFAFFSQQNSYSKKCPRMQVHQAKGHQAWSRRYHDLSALRLCV